MRHVGKIKWFGGYNRKTDSYNNYGFIGSDGRPDVYIHRREVRCPESALQEGTPVTFEIGVNRQTGREEAKNLLLLTEETDVDVLALAVHSSDERIWKPVFGEYLATLVPDDAEPLVIEKIAALSSRQRSEFVRSLPKSILSFSQTVRGFLPTDEQFRLCLEILDTDTTAEQPMNRAALLVELRGFLEELNSPGIWESVPDTIVLEEQVWPAAPQDRQMKILASQLSKEEMTDNEDTILRIVQVLSESPLDERPSLVAMLPAWAKNHDAIFALQPLVDQVNQVWSSLELGSLRVWHKLSRQAKILCVYRAAKENRSLSGLASVGEDDPLVRCALILLWAKENPQKSDAAFEKAHRLFQDYVVTQAWNSTEPLDLYPLLPHCRPGVVEYCEGKPWVTDEDKRSGSNRVSRAFCPRRKRGCGLFDPSEADAYDVSPSRWDTDVSSFTENELLF